MGGNRFIVALIIAPVIFVLVLTVIGHHLAPAQTSPPPALYEGVEHDDELLRMDRRALEEAYHNQILKLFSVWVSSGAPADAQQLQNGLRIARRAYQQASQQIAKREQEYNMRPQQSQSPK